MLCTWLWKKTATNPDHVEGAVIGGLLLLFYPIILAAVAGDAVTLVIRMFCKAIIWIARLPVRCIRRVIDYRRRVRNERDVLRLAILQRQRTNVRKPNVIEQAHSEYEALREQIRQLPFDEAQINALLLAAERRVFRAVKERIDGIG